jgi:tetrahydromethanopterin S-methyltransferase subunit A
VAITGTLTTENLGIERLVANTIANPSLRFVIVSGPEAEQRIGHRPGGSLLALAANGTDERGRIVAAPGRRPRLRNLTAGEIAHFRAHVEVIDLIGTQDAAAVLAGYLIVHADAARRLLVIEHYHNDGLLTTIVEAASATDAYTSVLADGLVSRLDQAAYLGRELARAEHALQAGTGYRQDAAPG